MVRLLLTLPVSLALWLLPFLLYAVSPLGAAVALKHAIENGNEAYVERAIQWDTVRATLRSSMKSVALDRPLIAPERPPALSPVLAQKPGYWARFKGYLGEKMVDGLVDRYANAKGLPKLFTYGQAVKRVTGGTVDEPVTLATLPKKATEFWARVRHAAFVSATRFEIEFADKDDPARRFTGLFELKDWRWQLTRLYVHTEKHPLGRLEAADKFVLSSAR